MQLTGFTVGGCLDPLAGVHGFLFLRGLQGAIGIWMKEGGRSDRMTIGFRNNRFLLTDVRTQLRTARQILKKLVKGILIKEKSIQ